MSKNLVPAYGPCHPDARVIERVEEPVEEQVEPEELDTSGPWPCSCGCSCRETHYNPTGSYCKRCNVGDCPHPDEDIPEVCPECGKMSDLAMINEFGWCLRDTCRRPRRY